MAQDRDKPNVTATIADLDAGEKPSPFVFMTRGNKRITFPDIYDLDWQEAEEFMLDVQDKKNAYVLERWLSKEDYETIKSEKMSLREMITLLSKVENHYQMSMGNSGEDNAS